jgi:hypothetical protein
MYTVWHVDRYKITFQLVINWTNQILQHTVVSSGLSRPGKIYARARYRAAARRLRNTALVRRWTLRHTVHKLSQRRLTANLLAPRESDCSRMHNKFFWLADKLHRGHNTGDWDILNGWILSGQPSYIHTHTHTHIYVSQVKASYLGIQRRMLATRAVKEQ